MHRHFGNLADVFKHVALAEIVGALGQAEYWESHAGAAAYQETGDVSPERAHGVHFFFELIQQNAVLAASAYGRVLKRLNANRDRLTVIPGSPRLALELAGERTRRLLFCDTDADALLTIRKMSEQPRIECVQEDGVSVLRGAALVLAETWAAGTLAFLDPFDAFTKTDADISPLDLWCELANKGIAGVLWYGFADEAARSALGQRMQAALEKTLLAKKGAQRFEGAMKGATVATQWGFGLLMMHVPGAALEKVDAGLKALEAAYEKSAGPWKYGRASM